MIKKIWDMRADFNPSLIKNPLSAVGYIILTSVAFSVIVFISSYAWKMILQFLYGKKIAFKEIREVYAKSNIGKYLPGGVMHFAGRNILGKKLGFSQIDMALSTIIEAFTLLIAACVWSLVFAYKSFSASLASAFKKANPIVIAIVAAVIVVIIIAAAVYAYKKGFLQKYKKLFSVKFLLLFLRLFIIYSFTMILPGIFLVVIFSQVLLVPLTLYKTVLIIAAYMISWAAGYVVIGAPGGIGVREAILLAILGISCGNAQTLLAALLHRISSIVGDALAFLFEFIIEKFTTKG